MEPYEIGLMAVSAGLGFFGSMEQSKLQKKQMQLAQLNSDRNYKLSLLDRADRQAAYDAWTDKFGDIQDSLTDYFKSISAESVSQKLTYNLNANYKEAMHRLHTSFAEHGISPKSGLYAAGDIELESHRAEDIAKAQSNADDIAAQAKVSYLQSQMSNPYLAKPVDSDSVKAGDLDGSGGSKGSGNDLNTKIVKGLKELGDQAAADTKETGRKIASGWHKFDDAVFDTPSRQLDTNFNHIDDSVLNKLDDFWDPVDKIGSGHTAEGTTEVANNIGLNHAENTLNNSTVGTNFNNIDNSVSDKLDDVADPVEKIATGHIAEGVTKIADNLGVNKAENAISNLFGRKK